MKVQQTLPTLWMFLVVDYTDGLALVVVFGTAGGCETDPS